MTKILNVCNNVDTDLLEDLIAFVNENADSDDPLLVYLTGDGGDPGVASAIIDVLNMYKDRIEVVGYSAIYSSSFRIFVLCKNKKRVLPLAYGVHHLTTITTEMNDNGVFKNKVAKDFIKTFKVDHSNSITEINKIIGITAAEKKDLDRGGDIVIGYDRLLKIIETQNKINVQ